MSQPMQNQTSTVPLPSSCPPAEFTVLTRFVSIPIVAASLSTINDRLDTNPLTRSPYSTAKGLSYSAYNFAVPSLQEKFAPLIVRADGYANKAVDVIEYQCPYPFKADPEDVMRIVRESSESAGKYVRESKESAVERVKSPMVHVAQGVDQSMKPIVNVFEIVVTRFKSGEPPQAEGPYQYQRASALLSLLTEHLYVLSNEHLKAFQEHNILVRRASETAQSISSVASSSLANAQFRVQALSGVMLQELHKVQQSTVELSNSVAASLPSVSAQANDLSNALARTIKDFRDILAKPMPLNDKVMCVRNEARDRILPVLEKVVFMVRGRAEEAKENVANNMNDSNVKQNGRRKQ